MPRYAPTLASLLALAVALWAALQALEPHPEFSAEQLQTIRRLAREENLLIAAYLERMRGLGETLAAEAARSLDASPEADAQPVLSGAERSALERAGTRLLDRLAASGEVTPETQRELRDHLERLPERERAAFLSRLRRAGRGPAP